MFTNILVAIDGSPDAELALGHAIDIARSENARLTIFAAVPSPPAFTYATPGASALAEIAEHAHQETEAIVRAALERVPDSIGATSLISNAPVRPALIGQIETGGHDLVVMGSRGRGAVGSALLGSVSHYVLHHGGVPVLIVPAADAPAA